MFGRQSLKKKKPCALMLLHTLHESLVVRMWPFSRHGCLYNSAQRTFCNTIPRHSASPCLYKEHCRGFVDCKFLMKQRLFRLYRKKHLRLHSVHFQWSYASVKPKSVKKGGYQLDFWHEFFAVLVFLRWLHVLHLSWFNGECCRFFGADFQVEANFAVRSHEAMQSFCCPNI